MYTIIFVTIYIFSIALHFKFAITRKLNARHTIDSFLSISMSETIIISSIIKQSNSCSKGKYITLHRLYTDSIQMNANCGKETNKNEEMVHLGARAHWTHPSVDSYDSITYIEQMTESFIVVDVSNVYESGANWTKHFGSNLFNLNKTRFNRYTRKNSI